MTGFSNNFYTDAVEVSPPDDSSSSYRISFGKKSLRKEDSSAWVSVTLVLVRERTECSDAYIETHTLRASTSQLRVKLDNPLVQLQPINAKVFSLVSFPMSSGKVEYNASNLEVKVERGSPVTFHFISLNMVCVAEADSGWWIVFLICLGCALAFLCHYVIYQRRRQGYNRPDNMPRGAESNTNIFVE